MESKGSLEIALPDARHRYASYTASQNANGTDVMDEAKWAWCEIQSRIMKATNPLSKRDYELAFPQAGDRARRRVRAPFPARQCCEREWHFGPGRNARGAPMPIRPDCHARPWQPLPWGHARAFWAWPPLPGVRVPCSDPAVAARPFALQCW